jgi:hypothetical protein
MKHAIAWIITFLITGCVSTDQLSSLRTFSSAAHDFSTSASDAFVKLNDSFVDRNIAKVAGGDQPLADATFVGVLDDSAGVKQTTAALTVLGEYANSLGALATANYGTEIDKAATGLYGSLSAIDKDAGKVDAAAPKISDTDFALLATLVKAIGDVAARDKQAAAIKQAVIMADPGVQAICTGVGKELDGVRSTYIKNLDDIYTDEFKAYQKEQSPLSFRTRMTRLQELRATNKSRQNADQFLSKLKDSAKSLASAHAKIKQSLTSSTISLADVTRAVGELKSYADELKTFNVNLVKGSP